MTIDKGAIWFDLPFPPERGYAYVAVSRFRTRAGVFHYGRYRRTDWLPVGGDAENEQTKRGYNSQTSDSEPEYEDESSDSEQISQPESDAWASVSDDSGDRCMFDDGDSDLDMAGTDMAALL